MEDELVWQDFAILNLRGLNWPKLALSERDLTLAYIKASLVHRSAEQPIATQRITHHLFPAHPDNFPFQFQVPTISKESVFIVRNNHLYISSMFQTHRFTEKGSAFFPVSSSGSNPEKYPKLIFELSWWWDGVREEELRVSFYFFLGISVVILDPGLYLWRLIRLGFGGTKTMSIPWSLWLM